MKLVRTSSLSWCPYDVVAPQEDVNVLTIEGVAVFTVDHLDTGASSINVHFRQEAQVSIPTIYGHQQRHEDRNPCGHQEQLQVSDEEVLTAFHRDLPLG